MKGMKENRFVENWENYKFFIAKIIKMDFQIICIAPFTKKECKNINQMLIKACPFNFSSKLNNVWIWKHSYIYFPILCKLLFMFHIPFLPYLTTLCPFFTFLSLKLHIYWTNTGSSQNYKIKFKKKIKNKKIL